MAVGNTERETEALRACATNSSLGRNALAARQARRLGSAFKASQLVTSSMVARFIDPRSIKLFCARWFAHTNKKRTQILWLAGGWRCWGSCKIVSPGKRGVRLQACGGQ